MEVISAQLPCAEEQIHIPGAIQPHGVIITVVEETFTIAQASESTLTIFGIACQDLIGQPIARLISNESQAELVRQASSDTAFYNFVRLCVSCQNGLKDFDAVIHRSEGLLLFEFEEAVDQKLEQSLDLFQASNQAIALVLSCTSKLKLFTAVAEFVRRLTGFDRVLIYLFDPDWTGTVVAERKAAEARSYLGLKFPATDIPVQARELYKRNRLRLLVDVEAVPVAIHPAHNPLTKAPLDLSGSILRVMAPVHIEYLKNMEVAASMSLSLISSSGELRGLIACHHSSAKHVDCRVRQACDFLSRIVSLQLDTIEERELFAKQSILKSARNDLLSHVSSEDELPAAIACSEKLLEVVGARGAAVVWDERCLLVGKTPDEQAVAQLVADLADTGAPIFVNDSLSKNFPAAKQFASSASGMLAIRLATAGSKWLLWFRPEQLEEVSWAGKQEELAPGDAGGYLHPRKSFELWKETISGKSVPWLSCEVQSAFELRTAVLDIALTLAERKRAAELQRKVEELDLLSKELLIARDEAMEASRRKSEMVSVVSHDLRAPLTSIRGSLSLLNGGIFEIEPEGAELVTLAYTGCDYLLNLINDLLNLESIESGGVTLEKIAVPIGKLINHAMQLVRSSADSKRIKLVAECESITVFADKDRLLQVLINLLSNAIKFSPDQSQIVVSARTSNRITTIKVTDHGRGVPPEFRHSIFQKYKQVEKADRSLKGGTGLGLSICQAIIKAHGGAIGVESEADKGSTFWFTLPQPHELFTESTEEATPGDSSLQAALRASEHELSQRTNERDDFELKLIESDLELSAVRSAFIEANHQHAADMATLTLRLSQIETLLNESNKTLTSRTQDFAESNADLKAVLQERACFVAALNDLRDPISIATNMLAYVAAENIPVEQKTEIVTQIIDANKRILSGAERLAEATLVLTDRTNLLQQRADLFEESNEKLRHVMQQREDFVAALTHDLKTPLTGSTRILELFVTGSFADPEQRTRMLNLVIESNKSMLRMIWNMLSIYRQEAGCLLPTFESVDVMALLKECLADFTFTIEEKRLRLIFDATTVLPLIEIDRLLLRRVLVNLLDNSVKFSPEGAELILGTASNQSELSLTFKNYGPSMSADQLEHLFQRFWQTKQGREKIIGTGLGLFSSKLIMDALGGRIECLSSETSGTTFTVTMQLNGSSA